MATAWTAAGRQALLDASWNVEGGRYLDASGSESLSRDECLAYLAVADLGHLALSEGALPVVLPVNLGLVEEHVIVRTQPGSKLLAAAQRAVVAVQAEGIDGDRCAWSVMVQGIAYEVRAPAEVARLRRLGPVPLVRHRGGHFIAVPVQIVSGRRFGLRRPDISRLAPPAYGQEPPGG